MAVESQWFYLEGRETRGPVDEAALRQLFATGKLQGVTLVAQPGWQRWIPVSEALGAGGSPAGPPPLPPPAVPIAAGVAIQLRCLSGPDFGKTYWVGPTAVVLGKTGGFATEDPGVADQHLQLAWRGNLLEARGLAGQTLTIDGAPVAEAHLVQGQRFQIGSSIWQVGRLTVHVGELIQSLGDRLNRFASLDKLEGFSLGEMFSEVFKKRTPEEIDDYFLVGTYRTTPPIQDVQTGWPKPWLFLRVLLFIGIVYVGFLVALHEFGNPRLIPGLIMVGSIAVPAAVLILFFELNTPRNVSLRHLIMLFSGGGVVSLFVALIGFRLAHLGWLGALGTGLIEESAKLVTVALMVRQTRFKYILNGILLGAAIGAGFSAFETAGYAFWDALLQTGSLDVTMSQILYRSVLVPLGDHVIWTAIAAAAFWRAKGDRPLALGMFFDPAFLRLFSIPVLLHAAWDIPFSLPFYLKETAIGLVGWFIVLGLVQQGLRQVKDEQQQAARRELESTRSMTGQMAAVAAR